jgi:hypothetical protein
MVSGSVAEDRVMENHKKKLHNSIESTGELGVDVRLVYGKRLVFLCRL